MDGSEGGWVPRAVGEESHDGDLTLVGCIGVVVVVVVGTAIFGSLFNLIAEALLGPP